MGETISLCLSVCLPLLVVLLLLFFLDREHSDAVVFLCSASLFVRAISYPAAVVVFGVVYIFLIFYCCILIVNYLFHPVVVI